jgi:hypothetical protein
MWTAYLIVMTITGAVHIATVPAKDPGACISAIKSYSQPETIVVASGCIADAHRPQPERKPAAGRT